ncbi:type II secretion system F family protein [Spirillospora sp. NPDC127200]
MALLIAVGGALTVLLFALGFHLRLSGRPDVETGALVVTAVSQESDDFGPLGQIVNRLGRPFAPLVMRTISPAQRSKIRTRIERAGRPSGLTLDGYARNKAGCMALFGSVGLLALLGGSLLMGGALLLVGWFQTDIVLWNLSRERQTKIQRSLPDFLDVLTVTVSAGLGFRHALGRVAESMPGALSDEMMIALRQMELGSSFRVAFEELRRRNDSEALSTFVTAVLQAEELGAPLARALTEISTDMRRDSFQEARRRAQRADPQVTLIVTFLMVPGMALLICGIFVFGTNVQLGGVFGG